MSHHMAFNGCDDALKARLQAYWVKKLPRLERLLEPYREDLREIRLSVYNHAQSPQRNVFEVRGVIRLPTGTLAAQADDKDPQAALDRVADKLVAEIKRHKDHVRHDYLFKRKSRERQNISAAGPLLNRDKDAGRQEEFNRLLRPLLGFLRDHARRELRILELEGSLHSGEVSVDDVLDEVLVRAWQHFAERPRKMRLELWLTDLLHETLEDWIKQEPRPHVSTRDEGEEKRPSQAPQVDEQEWWAWLVGYRDSLLVEDLIPGSDGQEAWQELDAQEQWDRVLSLLGKLPAAQRQAFQLHVLEDYDTAEIAMLQDRPKSEVKADIESARQTLRRHLARSIEHA